MTEKEISLMSALSLVLLECQQPQKAIVFLRALVILEKNSEKYILALAWAYLQANQPENALRVLRLLPDAKQDALPHLLSAQTLAKLKRFDDAKQEFTLFVDKKQHDVEDSAAYDADIAVDEN